ncbi:unnamed protein product [Caenorhabditis auriculariae]|uniref:Uncharacterized protein n=1 Tax=Caenorhabditis auriculariae TaxID=2777116 RepID=A0A8S1HM52_9PELO|nr:unnamed protein product [Caenorhabditis auriculariae]
MIELMFLSQAADRHVHGHEQYTIVATTSLVICTLFFLFAVFVLVFNVRRAIKVCRRRKLNFSEIRQVDYVSVVGKKNTGRDTTDVSVVSSNQGVSIVDSKIESETTRY